MKNHRSVGRYFFLFCSNLNKEIKLGRFLKGRSGYGKQTFFFFLPYQEFFFFLYFFSIYSTATKLCFFQCHQILEDNLRKKKTTCHSKIKQCHHFTSKGLNLNQPDPFFFFFFCIFRQNFTVLNYLRYTTVLLETAYFGGKRYFYVVGN